MNTFEPYTYEDLAIIRNSIEGKEKSFLTMIFITLGLLAIVLFVPTSVLSIFSRKGRRLSDTNDSYSLFVDIGPTNVMLFILLPIAIVFTLLYFYLFKLPATRRDLLETEKEIGTVKVAKVEVLSKADQKDLMGQADYITVFESNEYGLDEEMFLSTVEPEKLRALIYKVQVTKNARILLKKEIVGTYGSNK